MNTLEFGSDIQGSSNMYLRVKQKGDKIQFRIAQNPTYVGKHFIKKQDGWSVPNCPRINSQEECDMCEKYFEIMSSAKSADKKEADELKKVARDYAVSITFYFPVLNREEGKFGILQTTRGVRNKINEFYENGTDVFSKDFVLRNTGSDSPKDLYSLTIVDSSDTPPLTEEEEAELKKAKEFDMSTINDGTEDEIE